jgi:outer membrane protein TolC
MGSSSGGSGLTDLYRIMIEAGELENNLASIRSQERSIIARFNSYLDRPSLTPVFTEDILSADSLFFPLDELPDTLIAQSPMLAMLEFEGQAYEARRHMVTRMGFPMVGLGVDYSIINRSEMSASPMNGRDMIMPMVSVTLPIYRKKYRAMQTEAGLLSTAASQSRQSASNKLQSEYYQALQMYEDAQRRVRLYKSQYQLASRSLDLIMKSFAVSASGLTDVLRVQQQTLDYELKQAEAVADLNTAVAWLNRLTASIKSDQF